MFNGENKIISFSAIFDQDELDAHSSIRFTMIEKKTSFKAYFTGLTAITIKNIYELLANIGVGVSQLSELITELDKINPLLEQTNSFIVVSDATSFAIPYVSPSCFHIIGYRPEEWTSKGLSFLLENYCMADATDAFFDRIMRHKKKLNLSTIKDYRYTTYFRFFHKRGYFIWLQNHWVFYFNDEKGKMLYSISLLTNVDQFKRNDTCSLQIANASKNAQTLAIEESHQLQPYGASTLSYIELEILRLLSHGFDNSAIAQELHLKETTVKTYRKRMLKKTWCSNTVELVYYAIKNGLID